MECHGIDTRGTDERLFATFFLDQLEFALDVAYVQDAIPRPNNIVPLPATPDYLSGVISLRNNIVPIVDTRKRFRIPAPSKPREGHIAITRCKARFMGLTFDRINEVIRVNSRQMETLAPEFQAEGNLVADVIKLDEGRRLVQVIDPLSMFDFQELPPQLQQQAILQDDQPADTRRQALSFYIGDERFGMDIDQVREIITVPEISQRVLVEDYILGVIALRGERISIIDLRMFVGEGPSVLTPEHRIIILRDESFTVGILVDGVKEVLSFGPKDLAPMPPLVGDRHSGGFCGVIEKPDGAVVLLNIMELFSAARERIAGHLRINDDNVEPEQNFAIGQTRTLKHKGHGQTYITFALDTVYGAPIEQIREIVPANGNIHHLPGQVDYIEGFINLRAEVIPVINLRRYFDVADDPGSEKLIMIFAWNDRRVGILIDQLLRIVTLDQVEEQKIPKLLARREESRFRGTLARIIEIADADGNPNPTMIIDVARFMAAVTASTKRDDESSETAFSVLADDGPALSPQPAIEISVGSGMN